MIISPRKQAFDNNSYNIMKKHLIKSPRTAKFIHEVYNAETTKLVASSKNVMAVSGPSSLTGSLIRAKDIYTEQEA